MGRSRKLTRGERNCKWIEEHCRIPEGKYVGRPLKLRKFQKDAILGIYNTPTRRVIISYGRKNAKTTLAAVLLLLHTCGPEASPNSQLYSTAQSREQAAVVFALAAKIVRFSPDLSQYVVVRDTAKQLACPELGTLYRALSAEASTAYGLSPALVVHDELGQVKGPRSELYEAMETASAAQENPLSVIISTQAPSDGDLLSILIDDAMKGNDPETKVFLYTAPMEMDPFSVEAIKAANPAFDEFMNQSEVLKMAASAKRMPMSEPSYRNLVLNQRVEARAPFVSRTVWQENGTFQSSAIDGREIYCGLDLSSVSDLTSLTSISKVPDGKQWDVWSDFWLPEEGLIEKARKDREPYDLWRDNEHLLTCPGSAVQYEYIAAYLRELFDRCIVRKVSFDRWNMKFLIPWLEKAGFTPEELERFVEFGQGFVSMSPALRELESALLNRLLRHGMQPVLQMCAKNATVITDAAGNRKFIKGKSTGKIDGMVTLAMCVAVAGVELSGSGESVYEERGLLIL